MDDLISRQAAIDAIHEDILLKPHNDSWFRENHEFVTVGYVERTLLAVPSAQPEQVCVANITLTDKQVMEAVEKAKNAVISVIEPERKKGRWLTKEQCCSECGVLQLVFYQKFCHVCGAEMVEQEEDYE